MGILTTSLDATVGAVQSAKEQSVKNGQRNLPPTILCLRGDQLIAMVQLPHNNRDDILNVAQVAAHGYEADVITLSMESWHSVTPVNPLTGKFWASGEMDDAAEHHQAVEKGWIRDALTVAVANRADDLVQEVMPYEVHGRKVTWLPLPDGVPARASTSDEGVRFGGVIPDALRQIMAMPVASVQMRRQGNDMDEMARNLGILEERMIAHRDCAITKLILDPPADWLAKGFLSEVAVAIGAKPGSPRDQVMRYSMPDVPRKPWSDN